MIDINVENGSRQYFGDEERLFCARQIMGGFKRDGSESLRDLHNLVHELEDRGIALKALDQNIDTSTPHGKAFLGMLATFAEFETNIRKERQLEGIAKAKQEGKYKGRKATAMEKKADVLVLLEQGMSKPKIAEKLGISIASVYNVLKAA